MLGSFSSCPLSPFTKLCILDPVFILQNMSSHMGASDIFSKLCKEGTTDFLWKVINYENNAEYLFNKKILV